MQAATSAVGGLDEGFEAVATGSCSLECYGAVDAAEVFGHGLVVVVACVAHRLLGCAPPGKVARLPGLCRT